MIPRRRFFCDVFYFTSRATFSRILRDPGADSGGERKSKRAGKYGTKKYFPARLDVLLRPHYLPLGLPGCFSREIRIPTRSTRAFEVDIKNEN